MNHKTYFLNEGIKKYEKAINHIYKKWNSLADTYNNKRKTFFSNSNSIKLFKYYNHY